MDKQAVPHAKRLVCPAFGDMPAWIWTELPLFIWREDFKHISYWHIQKALVAGDQTIRSLCGSIIGYNIKVGIVPGTYFLSILQYPVDIYVKRRRVNDRDMVSAASLQIGHIDVGFVNIDNFPFNNSSVKL